MIVCYETRSVQMCNFLMALEDIDGNICNESNFKLLNDVLKIAKNFGFVVNDTGEETHIFCMNQQENCFFAKISKGDYFNVDVRNGWFLLDGILNSQDPF